MVGALSAGLDVLHYLVRADAPVGVSQVARDLELSTSTCFNLLRTLVHERLVEFDPVKKRYTVGVGLLDLTKGMLERDQHIKLLRPRLERLVSLYRVTGTLWRRFDADRAILVDRSDSASAVRVHMTVGQRLPLYIGALGRCFAAFSGLGRDEIRTSFDRMRWDNAPSFRSYWEEVERTREVGFAIDRDNFTTGVTSVSVPVLDERNIANMAISAIGFSAQMNDETVADLVAELREDARLGETL